MGNKNYGAIKLWADLLDHWHPGDSYSTTPSPSTHCTHYTFPIERPSYLEYELRCIIYATEDCVYKDKLEGCNDLFVRGYPGNQEAQETDTHWRCRDKGSFNWRMKFPVFFPLRGEQDYGNDWFFIQVLDRDLVGSNELIGEAVVDLN